MHSQIKYFNEAFVSIKSFKVFSMVQYIIICTYCHSLGLAGHPKEPKGVAEITSKPTSSGFGHTMAKVNHSKICFLFFFLI
jgi:hypothetical protein